MICAAEAASSKNPEEREALLRKRQSLLALADNEDWLAGQPPLFEKLPQRPAAAKAQPEHSLVE